MRRSDPQLTSGGNGPEIELEDIAGRIFGREEDEER